MNHISTRRQKKKQIILERIIAVLIGFASVGVIIWQWIEVAFFDFPEGYALIIVALAIGIHALAIKYWSILNEEEGVDL